jgi:hypothetical protein
MRRRAAPSAKSRRAFSRFFLQRLALANFWKSPFAFAATHGAGLGRQRRGIFRGGYGLQQHRRNETAPAFWQIANSAFTCILPAVALWTKIGLTTVVNQADNLRGAMLTFWRPDGRCARLPFWPFLGWTPKKSACSQGYQGGVSGSSCLGRRATHGSISFASHQSTRRNSRSKQSFGKRHSQAELGNEGSGELWGQCARLVEEYFFWVEPKKVCLFLAPQKSQKSPRRKSSALGEKSRCRKAPFAGKWLPDCGYRL